MSWRLPSYRVLINWRWLKVMRWSYPTYNYVRRPGTFILNAGTLSIKLMY